MGFVPRGLSYLALVVLCCVVPASFLPGVLVVAALGLMAGALR
jgi:hypothetical protein